MDKLETNYSLSPELKNFLEKIKIHRESAQLAIARAQETQAKYHNWGQRPAPEYEPGDLVLVNPHSLEWKESKGKGVKLIQCWIGPFQVAEKINPKVYRLKMSDKYPGMPVFNIDHLKGYRESPKEWEHWATPPETWSRKESDEYEVEGIVGHRRKGSQLEYLIRWEGYGPSIRYVGFCNGP